MVYCCTTVRSSSRFFPRHTHTRALLIAPVRRRRVRKQNLPQGLEEEDHRMATTNAHCERNGVGQLHGMRRNFFESRTSERPVQSPPICNGIASLLSAIQP